MINYIVSIHHKLDFINIQYNSIKKYVKQPYVYIVFNDSTDKKISNYCKKMNIKCINIPQKIHSDRNLIFPTQYTKSRELMNNPEIYQHHGYPGIFSGYNSTLNNHSGSRHCDSIQFIINYFYYKISNCNLLMNIDADMCFINFFNLNNYLERHSLAMLSQSRNDNWTYMWPNIFIFNLNECPNINEICWDGCFIYHEINDSNYNDNCFNYQNKQIVAIKTDTGGETHYYLEKYKDRLKIKEINIKRIFSREDLENNVLNNDKTNLFLKKMNELHNNNGPDKEILLDNCILHFRGLGSNWLHKPDKYITYITKMFREIYIDD